MAPGRRLLLFGVVVFLDCRQKARQELAEKGSGARSSSTRSISLVDAGAGRKT